MTHQCNLTNSKNEALYLCSRCGRCYVCHHEAVWMNDTWVWKVKLRGGKIKFEPVVYDGKVILPGSQPQTTSLGATAAT